MCIRLIVSQLALASPGIFATVGMAGEISTSQLKSGGWTAWIDFDPSGSAIADNRNGCGNGRDDSSLDVGQTQAATLLLARADQALEFQGEKIHEATMVALDALLAAQFPNGGFPQVWSGPVADQPVINAKFPNYDWRTEGRIKEYWNLYTLNDDLVVTVTETLAAAFEIHKDQRYKKALHQLWEFPVLAQLPAPQPAWAQQYNYDMVPVWARIYELKTNRPLYMSQEGKVYSLTYDDSKLPDHYSFKVAHQLAELEVASQGGSRLAKRAGFKTIRKRARAAVDSLDARGRRLSPNAGEQEQLGDRVISSEVFSDKVGALCDYLEASQSSP